MNSVSDVSQNLYASTLNAYRNTSGTLDKDAFLRLLVTELKNQNPMEPMDNREFISQMAQFSTLEQISNLSNSIEKFVETESVAMKLNAVGLIGKKVVIEGKSLQLESGQTDSIIFSLDENAEVVLKIYDENGTLVSMENLGTLEAGMHSYLWDGRSNDGVMLPDGEYTYELKAITPEGEKEIGGLEEGEIEAVQFSDDGIYVIVNGNKYPIDSVKEVSA
ncbi:MAG: flagellar basal-body rod modification protein FlgD [Thermotogaceae bacterium]|jgi:flagellar basal-body rod modification protein FlgD|nr:flagellar basal-body rod modification protein FlgD [Thermotogaceae bacterium]MDN5337859.1 flagellar basal-body rod modification protein FlgD [Thermotogaceae bacterium]